MNTNRNLNELDAVPQMRDETELVPVKELWRAAQSLKPTVATMNAYIEGNEEAVEIIESYKLRESRATVVRKVSKAEHQRLIERTEGISW